MIRSNTTADTPEKTYTEYILMKMYASLYFSNNIADLLTPVDRPDPKLREASLANNSPRSIRYKHSGTLTLTTVLSYSEVDEETSRVRDLNKTTYHTLRIADLVDRYNRVRSARSSHRVRTGVKYHRDSRDSR